MKALVRNIFVLCVFTLITPFLFADEKDMSWLRLLILSNEKPEMIDWVSSVSFAENRTASVVRVRATDPDRNRLTYKLTGTDASAFQINRWGVVRFNTAPDYEAKTSYSVNVEVSDGSDSTTEALTINITNKNDNDPVITSSASFSAAENQTAVGTVTATDADGDDLTFSLSGDDADSFSIDSSSGVLTFDSAPDFETKSAYVVTVEVNDGSNTVSQGLTVDVTNIGDAWVQRGADIDGEGVKDTNGFAVALSDDASIVTTGAYGDDDNGKNSGHVRIYEWSDDTWTQIGSDIDGETEGDNSGRAVALSADGITVGIGARKNAANGANSGHVRVYEWDGSDWTQLGSDIDGEAAGDRSGHSISLSEDGATIAIGADGNDEKASGSGHVRIYDWNGVAWAQRGNDIEGESQGDLSGRSVSLSADGETVAIGAYGNNGNGKDSGHVRIYDWGGDSWIQRGSDIDGEAARDLSGFAVALSEEGDTVAIGAYKNDAGGEESGHVRVYDWEGDTWTQRGSDIDGEAEDDRSGYVIALSDDGLWVAIGAYLNDGNGEDSGHVRVYGWSEGSWVQRGSDIDGEAEGDRSGISVSLAEDGKTVAIGAYLNDGNGGNSGHVRVYDWQ